MIKWIARWFNQSAASAPVATPSAVTAGLEPAPPAGDIHLLFYRWLASPPGADVPPSTEKLIIDEFTRLVEAPQSGADLVPRVPR
jgi:hypothetical protein